MTKQYLTSDETQRLLGERLRALRLDRNVTQTELAAKAGVSRSALRSLEAGAGSSVETLLRVLKALDRSDALETLVPKPTVRPMELLRRSRALPKRAGRRRARARGSSDT